MFLRFDDLSAFVVGFAQIAPARTGFTKAPVKNDRVSNLILRVFSCDDRKWRGRQQFCKFGPEQCVFNRIKFSEDPNRNNLLASSGTINQEWY